MHSERVPLALIFSIICVASALPAKASTITVGTDYFMTVSNYSSGEQNSGGYFVGDTTITLYADNGGVKGSQVASYTNAYCIDFEDQIHTPQTYLVEAQGVGSTYIAADSPTPGSLSTTLTDQKLEDDSVLGSEFNGNLTNDINTQEDIWDEGGAWFTLNSIQMAEATAAEAAASSTNPANGIAFLEINGDGQSFMVDGQTPNTPTAVTPEPSSLVLLGTGLLGTVGAVRRRRRIS